MLIRICLDTSFDITHRIPHSDGLTSDLLLDFSLYSFLFKEWWVFLSILVTINYENTAVSAHILVYSTPLDTQPDRHHTTHLETQPTAKQDSFNNLWILHLRSYEFDCSSYQSSWQWWRIGFSWCASHDVPWGVSLLLFSWIQRTTGWNYAECELLGKLYASMSEGGWSIMCSLMESDFASCECVCTLRRHLQ